MKKLSMMLIMLFISTTFVFSDASQARSSSSVPEQTVEQTAQGEIIVVSDMLQSPSINRFLFAIVVFVLVIMLFLVASKSQTSFVLFGSTLFFVFLHSLLGMWPQDSEQIKQLNSIGIVLGVVILVIGIVFVILNIQKQRRSHDTKEDEDDIANATMLTTMTDFKMGLSYFVILLGVALIIVYTIPFESLQIGVVDNIVEIWRGVVLLGATLLVFVAPKEMYAIAQNGKMRELFFKRIFSFLAIIWFVHYLIFSLMTRGLLFW